MDTSIEATDSDLVGKIKERAKRPGRTIDVRPVFVRLVSESLVFAKKVSQDLGSSSGLFRMA